MLSLKGVPDDLEELYGTYKNLAREIYAACGQQGSSQRIAAHTDLFACTAHSAIIFINDGYFKLQYAGKDIRLYSEADFIIIDGTFAGYTLRSDFAGDVTFFRVDTLTSALKSVPGLIEKWARLQSLENNLSLSLCAFHLADDVHAQFQFKKYQAGEVITREGDLPDGIYELISGSATVFRNDTAIGEIKGGEVFGEISFLTESARSATVRANGACFVRVVNKEDFAKLIQANPHVIISISKTLAHRVVQLNNKIIEVGI